MPQHCASIASRCDVQAITVVRVCVCVKPASRFLAFEKPVIRYVVRDDLVVRLLLIKRKICFRGRLRVCDVDVMYQRKCLLFARYPVTSDFLLYELSL